MLTERQMLEALLLVSANDIAYSLAIWDAGTESAFVAKMNALAASLGATLEPLRGRERLRSGLAVDGHRLPADRRGGHACILTFAAVVAMPTASLPLVGTVHNIVPRWGSDGVVGIKSGYTSQAGGCYVLAGVRTVVDGRPVTVLVAVLGQPVPPAVPISTTTTAPGAPPRPLPAPADGRPTTTTCLPVEFTVPDLFRYTSPMPTPCWPGDQAGVVMVTVSNARGGRWARPPPSWGGRTYRVPVVTAHSAWLLRLARPAGGSATELPTGGARQPEGEPVGSALFALGLPDPGGAARARDDAFPSRRSGGGWSTAV